MDSLVRSYPIENILLHSLNVWVYIGGHSVSVCVNNSSPVFVKLSLQLFTQISPDISDVVISLHQRDITSLVDENKSLLFIADADIILQLLQKIDGRDNTVCSTTVVEEGEAICV